MALTIDDFLQATGPAAARTQTYAEMRALLSLDTTDAVAFASLTLTGALTTDSAAIGGGYASTGIDLSNAGNLQMAGVLTVDGASTLTGAVGTGALTAASLICTAGATFGGGYASTGVTISTAGVVQIAGATTIDGLTTIGGALDLDGDALTSAGDLTMTPGGGSLLLVGNQTIVYDTAFAVSSATLNEGLRIEGGAGGGDGNVGGVVSFTSPGRGVDYKAAAVGAIQIGADTDICGLAFFAKASAGTTGDLFEAMRITNAGHVLYGNTTTLAPDTESVNFLDGLAVFDSTSPYDILFGVFDNADDGYIEIYQNTVAKVHLSGVANEANYIINGGSLTLGGDLLFSGGGSGLPYGECFADAIAWSQVAAINTWYAVSDASMGSGELNLVTHDGNGQLTLTTAGVYLATYNFVIASSAANQHIEMGLEIQGAGTPDASSHTHHEMKFANEETSLSHSALITVTAGQTVNGILRTVTAGNPTLTIEDLHICVVMIGG